MKNPSLIAVSICSAILSIESHAEKIGNVERAEMHFGPRPLGLTNRPTIGQPAFIVPDKLLGRLGGPEVTNLVVSTIGNLLMNSERFALTYANRPQYECRVTLSDLQIHQVDKGTTGGTGDAISGWFKQLGSKFKIDKKLTTVDWSKDEVQMKVRCQVAVQIVDFNTKHVLAGNTGEVDRTDTTGNINMDLGGLTFGRGETNVLTPHTVSFESRLILLASYRALTNMLPQLDKQLLNLPPPSFEVTRARAVDEAEGARPGTGKPTGSVVERLKELKDLLNQKLITETDYEKAKQKILDAAF